MGMTRFSSKWILSHSTWYKVCRSGHAHKLSGTQRCIWRFRADELDAMLGTSSADSADKGAA